MTYERVAVEHRRLAPRGCCGAILQNERSKTVREVTPHRLGVGQRYPGGSGRRFAEIALIDGAKEFFRRMLAGRALPPGERRNDWKCEYSRKPQREAAT